MKHPVEMGWVVARLMALLDTAQGFARVTALIFLQPWDKGCCWGTKNQEKKRFIVPFISLLSFKMSQPLHYVS